MLTGQKILVNEENLVKRGGTWYYLEKPKSRPQLNINDFNLPRRTTLGRAAARQVLIQKVIRRLHEMRQQISYELIIKTSMILALFYTGNIPMAIVLCLISIMSFLAKFKLDVTFDIKSPKVQLLIKIVYSWFASMFLINYEA